MRYVFDTNVLVAALRSDQGASRKLFEALLGPQIQALMSVPLMIEYEAVLTRPEQLAATGLSIDETNILLDAFVAVAEQISLHFFWRPQLKDPDDDLVLETAVSGRADRLVTFNLRHLQPAAGEFGILAVTPPTAWKELESRDAKK